jgi:hypothetical protein
VGLPDVKHDGFCFSDGVGYISSELASFVARKMDLTQASAF